MSKLEVVYGGYIAIGSLLGTGIMSTNIYNELLCRHSPLMSKGEPKSAAGLFGRATWKGIAYFMAWPLMLSLDARAELYRPKGHEHTIFHLSSCRKCGKYHGQPW